MYREVLDELSGSTANFIVVIRAVAAAVSHDARLPLVITVYAVRQVWTWPLYNLPRAIQPY